MQATATSPQLTDVSMQGQDLQEVPVDVLTQAVAYLGRFNLMRAILTTLQKTSVLQAIVSSTCTVYMGVAEGDIPDQAVREARETGRLQP